MEDEQDGQSHIHMFSDDKKLQGVLSAKFGEGWETSLPMVDMVRGLDWCRRVVV